MKYDLYEDSGKAELMMSLTRSPGMMAVAPLSRYVDHNLSYPLLHAFSEPECARGGPILFLKSISHHSP